MIKDFLTKSTLTMYSILSDFFLTDFLTWGSSFFGLPLYTISFRFDEDLDIFKKEEAKWTISNCIIILRMWFCGAAIAQWISLRLPSCRPGFESQAHYAFINNL